MQGLVIQSRAVLAGLWLRTIRRLLRSPGAAGFQLPGVPAQLLMKQAANLGNRTSPSAQRVPAPVFMLTGIRCFARDPHPVERAR